MSDNNKTTLTTIRSAMNTTKTTKQNCFINQCLSVALSPSLSGVIDELYNKYYLVCAIALPLESCITYVHH